MILPDDLYADVKKVAAEQHRTATSVVEEALIALLRQYAARADAAERPPFAFTGYGAGGPLPGIDLADSAALRAAMDGALLAAHTSAA